MVRKTIGIIIADDKEFAPVHLIQPKGAQKQQGSFYGMDTVSFFYCQAEREIEARVVHCGIGLVNAAATTAYLIADGIDGVVNEGLSGALSKLSRGDIVIGSCFYQHDFDTTALGYRPGEIYQEDYPVPGDNILSRHYQACYPQWKSGGLAGGDQFICSDQMKRQIVERFGCVACDMESAAIALICHKQKVPFAVIRVAADDARDRAAEVYREINEQMDASALEMVLRGVHTLLGNDAFWDIP